MPGVSPRTCTRQSAKASVGAYRIPPRSRMGQMPPGAPLIVTSAGSTFSGVSLAGACARTGAIPDSVQANARIRTQREREAARVLLRQLDIEGLLRAIIECHG